MRKLLAMAMIITMLCLTTLGSYSATDANSVPNSKSFKVMGYFCESPFDDPIDESVQFGGLTHLIYAFVRPNADGSLMPIGKPERLKELVEKSHKHGVKVVISVGGVMSGNERVVTNFEALTAQDESIAIFVNNMAKFVDAYQLDGIEVDWEFPTEQSKMQYEKLVVALREMLTKKGKTLSAAVASSVEEVSEAPYLVGLSDKALASLDWINIMAYGLGGGLKGQHSPYWHANVSVHYYLKRGVAPEKIVLGIPLFAMPSWKQYRNLVAQNKENAYSDYVPDVKLPSYYNGVNTIKDKTRLALNLAGGVMFFDINEDTHDDTSAQLAAVNMIERYEKYRLGDLFIVVNNHELVFPAEMGAPYIDTQNRTMVPIRQALETIGVNVAYDDKTKTVTMTKEDTVVQLVIGSDRLLVNGGEVKMDTVSVVKSGRTYMPLGAIYQNFGYSLLFHKESKTIFVNKN